MSLICWARGDDMRLERNEERKASIVLRREDHTWITLLGEHKCVLRLVEVGIGACAVKNFDQGRDNGRDVGDAVDLPHRLA